MSELKETFTREEADLMSLISAIVGENPNTFQGDSAYWDEVSIDFKTKEIFFTYGLKEKIKFLSYTIEGVASCHGYEFVELLSD